MKLHQLRYLVAILETGSLRTAAKELGISEPALSKSIHQLEEMLQVRLLDRSPRGAVPTVFGEALGTHAALILNQLAQARRELNEIQGAGQGLVRLGTGPTAAASNVPHAIASFQARSPDVRVVVREGLGAEMTTQVLQGRLDFAIIAQEAEVIDPDLETEPLAVSISGIIARSGHPLAAKREISLQDLANTSWVVPPKGDEVRDRFDQLIDKHEISPIRLAAESSSILFIVSFLTRTDSLGFLPHRLASDGRFGGDRLIALPAPRLIWRRQLLLVKRRRFSLSPAAVTLMRIIRQSYVNGAEPGAPPI
jgi:DNA-binding transcriptional LysR family regulator